MILYRPVGTAELELIHKSGDKEFPPRLPEQPIFYPVLNEQYACEIAGKWNAKTGDGLGYVTRFEIDNTYGSQFEVHTVGNHLHQELWVPAESLAEFNAHIIGKITVIKVFGDNNSNRVDNKSIVSVIWKNQSAYLLYDNEYCVPVFENGSFSAIDSTKANSGLKCDEIYTYDFNEELANPLDYGAVLERWNLLHDIATTKGMFFEGDSDRSTKTYNYLFRCVTSVDELPQRIAIPLKHLLCIKKVFRKQYRQLDYLFRNLNFVPIKTR